VLDIFTLLGLKQGWNLMSLPRMQSDTSLVTVLQSIEGLYDAVKWFDITDTDDSWKHYHIKKPSDMNDLDDINHTMGLWVHVTNPEGAILEVFGEKFTSTQNITLYKGWNLVGYPSNIARTPDFGLPPSVDMIQWFNSSSGIWESWDPGVYSPDNLEKIQPGQGLWIHCTQDTDVWTIEQVIPPTVDGILIVDMAGGGGAEILNGDLNLGMSITGYAAAFNISVGYIGGISVTWSVVNSDGANASTNPLTGDSSTFYSGDAAGTAIWEADDGDGHTDTVEFTIIP
jgi:hypothetical protein